MYMKLKKTPKTNTATTTVLEKEQVLNISQARAMFSDIIKTAIERPVFVGERGVPEALIINYRLGLTHLPKIYAQKKSGGEELLEKVQLWNKMCGKPKGKKINTWPQTQPIRQSQI